MDLESEWSATRVYHDIDEERFQMTSLIQKVN